MKKVITYGTFDTLHYGHINLLERARSLGDYLIVGLSTDEFNRTKNKESFHNWNYRKNLLKSIKYVDLIIPEKNWEQKRKDIQFYDIDIFTMGSDWSGHFDHLNDLCEVVYLERTNGISSTKIKEVL